MRLIIVCRLNYPFQSTGCKENKVDSSIGAVNFCHDWLIEIEWYLF